MKIEIEGDEIKTVDADPRGRVHLGPKCADERVTLVVLSTGSDDEGGEE